MNWCFRRRSIFLLRPPNFLPFEIWVVGLGLICLVCPGLRIAEARQGGQSVHAQATASQPYLNTRPDVEYVGDEVCRTCHSSTYETFKQTGMGRSTSIPAAEDLREVAKPVTILSKELNRSYKVYAREGKIIHEESGIDAAGHVVFSESHEIAFTVGAGDVGKSYLVSKGDALFVSPVSYYTRRPGTPLGDVAAIFSVPQAIKGNHFVALDQFEELKLSRCWAASNGRLGCISCHDPHVQLQGDAAADFFRSRCLTCHTNSSCTAPLAKRQVTAPPDNCILCHMPQQPTENIGHSSLTDHRILRTQSEIPASLQIGSSASLDLIYDTKPSGAGETRNLRNLAPAYAQVGEHYAELGQKGLSVLRQAAVAFPADAEIQAAYGKVLVNASPGDQQLAAQSLQEAVDLGSKSAEVRGLLARLKLQHGQLTAAMDLYKESIQMDPYLTPSYLDLARIYLMLKDRDNALKILDAVLKIDPGNDAARQERLKATALPDEKK